MRRPTIIVVVGLTLALSLTTDIASSSPQEPTFRAGVDVVQLDVTVLDGDRQPVRAA